MRILVVDDHELVRKGICWVLAAEPTLTICGEAIDGQDAVNKAKELQPDVVVMNISVPRMNGLDATRQIKELLPDAGVVILGQDGATETVRAAFKTGAVAYVGKSTIGKDLIAAMAKVKNHEPFIKGVAEAEASQNFESQVILQGMAAVERALWESEENFRAAMNNMADGLYTVDCSGLLTYINPSAEAMFGWTRAELIGKKMHDITHFKYPDGTPFPASDCPGLQVLKKGTELRDHEGTFIRKDGRFFPVVFSASPLKIEGRMNGIVVSFRDDSKYREAEDALRLRAAIVDSSDDAIISKDLDGIITSWNKGATRMFGYTAEEAIGKHITLIIPPERRDEESRILAQIRRGERIDHFETVRRRKDGSTVEISLTISPLKNGNGNVVGASKVARDITEEKKVERSLRESEERFRAIVETTPECVKLVNIEGILLHMNSSGLAMIEADSAESVTGKSVYNIIAPHDRHRYRDFNERICRGGVGSLEFDIQGLKGTSRHMETHAAPLLMPDGSVVQLAVTRDITDRKKAEEALQKSKEQLRTLADGLETQVEIRTLQLKQRNAAILQQSEQLRELSNRLLRTQDEERRRIARELHDGVGQLLAALSMNLSNLINEKSKLSTSASRSLDENIALIDQASQEIRTMSHLLHPPLLDEVGLESALRWFIDGFSERSKITVKMEMTPGFSKGLPRELSLSLFRIVQECLTNVHRHSGSLTAFVAIDRTTDEITLEVTDEGGGIAQEIQSKISSGESTGVGLRGMRERIRQFGGRLEICSDHLGTRVMTALPIAKLLPIGEEVTSKFQEDGLSVLKDAPQEPGHDTATILCIDDETAGSLPRKLLLESAGHRVIEARSGEEGIQLFQTQKVDAVILDYWMSGMKGTTVAFELKRMNPSVPIIVLSGVSELPGEAAGLVDQWLLKGSNRADKLLDSISALLERRPA